MRAAMRERMITIMARGALFLVINIGFLVPKAAAQSDKYPKMAPVDQYLMERNAEILLARSAAPDSISSDATVLILGRQGYETAVEGRNGWVANGASRSLCGWIRALVEVVNLQGRSASKEAGN
jgi:hypothetical protein